MHNFKWTSKIDIVTKTKVPIFFQICYPLVPKSEIFLKYFLDFFLQKQSLWRGISSTTDLSRRLMFNHFVCFLQFTNGFCLFSWFCFLLSLSSTELLHGMFMIPANTPQKVLPTSDLHSSSYRLFFLGSIAQFFTQIYMNCFVSS